MNHHLKQHSHFSYFFWTAIAVSSGVAIASLAVKGVRASLISLGAATEPIIYEARAEETPSSSAYSNPSISSEASKKLSYTVKSFTKLPALSASTYLIADIENGDIIFEKNRNVLLPIASLTKLMTAIVYLEAEKNSQTAIVSPTASAVPEAHKGDLREGQIIPANELIYPLLLESSNISAETIAEHLGRKNFMKNMNEKASSLGLKNTFFDDPSGISSNNTSTATDIFKLLSYINENKKYILDITTRKEQLSEWRSWQNNDKLAGLDNFLGGKTGFTQAAQKTFAGIFSLPISKTGDRKIAIVLLRSQDREDDVLKILDYLKANVYYE